MDSERVKMVVIFLLIFGNVLGAKCAMTWAQKKVTKTQRRIIDGKVLEEDKRYVVYLVKAEGAPVEYDAWLCGGAIVSKLYIITSAACVEDVQRMYAIAGYKKLVPADKLNSDQCTKAMKNRVIFTCVPKGYDLNYEKVEKWSFIDIAAVKVEKPFNFTDPNWSKLCSYQPVAIPINYETKHQEPGVDTLVFGWGHLSKWREPEDTTDYNQEQIHYAATRIYDKNECKKSYTQNPMAVVIDKYMICTLGAGNIDDKGHLIVKSKPVADGCTHNKVALKQGGVPCEEIVPESVLTRKSFSNILARQQNSTRKQGFCQNDHGGPLVTWVGGHEILIGIASVFRVTNDSLCTGPYLYTSTQCNGAFLDCVINPGNSTRRRSCDQDPSERGYDQIERNISWADYTEGLAESEPMMTTQDPIDEYYNLDWDTELDMM